MIVFIVILVVLILLLAACGAYFAYYLCCPKSSREDSIQWEIIHGVFRGFDKRENILEYNLKSFDGYELKTFYVPNPDSPDSNKYVIINHGYTSSHFGALKYLNQWMRLGYHCIIWDGRHHGDNVKCMKSPCTLGVIECNDFMTVLDDTYERFGPDIYLGLQGESMGSAIQITALKFKPKVHFIVNDCGFSSLAEVLKIGMKATFHLPAFLIYPADIMCRIIFRWSFFENRPIESLKDNMVPICFIHGAADDFILPNHSERMAAATKGYKELHFFDGAGHAESMYKDEERYYEILNSFLKKVESFEAK